MEFLAPGVFLKTTFLPMFVCEDHLRLCECNEDVDTNMQCEVERVKGCKVQYCFCLEKVSSVLTLDIIFFF